MKSETGFARLLLARLFLLAALPLGAIVVGPVQSADPGAAKDEPTPLFDELDTNHDDYLTAEEARRSAAVTARFKELDTDHDGKVSVDEYKKGMQPKL